MKKPSIIAPPPWELKGSGYIFVYKFDKEFINQNGFLQDFQKGNYKGFFGTVMLVDYSESAVGPYFELLFVPGLFKIGDKKRFSIAKIYVSSYDSVWNGIQNWGIPKEIATFKKSRNDNSEIFEASLDNQTFFKAEVQKGKFKFPISTAFFPLKLAQKLGNKVILTNSSAKGKATFSSLKSIEIDPNYFPDISKFKPILSLSVDDFKMVFPIPTIQ